MNQHSSVALQLMLAKRGGMALFQFGARQLIGKPERTQRRVYRIAVGRALAAKVAGRHNTAAQWFRIAVAAR